MLLPLALTFITIATERIGEEKEEMCGALRSGALRSGALRCVIRVGRALTATTLSVVLLALLTDEMWDEGPEADD